MNKFAFPEQHYMPLHLYCFFLKKQSVRACDQRDIEWLGRQSQQKLGIDISLCDFNFLMIQWEIQKSLIPHFLEDQLEISPSSLSRIWSRYMSKYFYKDKRSIVRIGFPRFYSHNWLGLWTENWNSLTTFAARYSPVFLFSTILDMSETILNQLLFMLLLDYSTLHSLPL